MSCWQPAPCWPGVVSTDADASWTAVPPGIATGLRAHHTRDREAKDRTETTAHHTRRLTQAAALNMHLTEPRGIHMFYRPRGLVFWLVLVTLLFIIAIAPVEFGHTILSVYHAIKQFFAGLHTLLQTLSRSGSWPGHDVGQAFPQQKAR